MALPNEENVVIAKDPIDTPYISHIPLPKN